MYDIIFSLLGHYEYVNERCVENKRDCGERTLSDLNSEEISETNIHLKLGILYKNVKTFCSMIQNLDCYSDYIYLLSKNGDSIPNSLSISDSFSQFNDEDLDSLNGYYISGLSDGMKDCLNIYYNFLIKVQNMMTKYTTIPSSLLSILIVDQNRLLKFLDDIVIKCYNYSSTYRDIDKLTKSSYLLEIIDEVEGDEILNNIRKGLKGSMLKVFKFQLRSWICYGKLLDPYQEFIIARRDFGNLDKNFQIYTNTTIYEAYSHKSKIYDSKLLEYEWNYRFYSKVNKGTTFGPIDCKTAKSILFIGKVHRMIPKICESYYKDHEKLADEYIFSVWDEILFDNEKFSRAIEQYRSYISSIFWYLYNKKRGLLYQINLFKTFYLLTQDSFYKEFFQETYNLMIQKYNPNSLQLISNQFEKIVPKLFKTSKAFNISTFPDLSPNYRRKNNILSNDRSHYSDDNDAFELVKYVINFNINSKFKIMNDVSYSNECVQVGADSSIWYHQEIYNINGFNIYLVVHLENTEIYREFSVVLSPKCFNSFRKYFKLNDDDTEYVSVNFKFIPNKDFKLTIIAQIIYNDMNNHIIKGNNIISKSEKVIEYKNLSKLKLEINLVFGKSSIKVNLRSIMDDEMFYTPKYSMENIFPSPKNYVDEDFTTGGRNEYRDNESDYESDEDRNMSVAFFRTNSMRSANHSLAKCDSDSENIIDMNMEINLLEFIEIIKLISESLFIGIINHSNDCPKQSYNYKKHKRVGKKGGRENSINILAWDYFNNLNKYDLLPYYKVKHFGNRIQFLEKINHASDEYEIKNAKDREEPSFFSIQSSYEGDVGVVWDVGINEWIYVMLYYKSKSLNLINVRSYNEMFQFLFATKRCLFGLQSLCLTNNKDRSDITKYQNDIKFGSKVCFFRKLFAYKHHFQNNINILLSYFYDQVIGPKYSEFETFVKTSHDFSQIGNKHDLCLSEILSKCLCNQYVLQAHFQCLDMCLKFTYMFQEIKDLFDLDSEEIDDLSTMLDNLREPFDENFSVLANSHKLYQFYPT